MLLSELIAAIESIAPARHAEGWDNVGLIAGDPAQVVSRVMLCIDYTAAVAEEARRVGCDCVIAYHPPIFDALKRVTAPSLVYDAIRRGVALYSPHTALDVAPGGTNDMLADVLGLVERRPLRAAAEKPSRIKFIVFVPVDAVEKVAAALFDAGAGALGDYSRCSFRTPGTGTFLPEAGANPAIGQVGQLEKVEEIRLEAIVPIDRIERAISAMRAAHPYEEPAFDLVQLAAEPAGRGMGRIGVLPRGSDRAVVIQRVKRELGIGYMLVAGPTTGAANSAACCAGACGELLNDALAAGADVYLTGEMRHHDALKAAARGMTVLCVLHSNSERKVLGRVAARLAELLPGVEVRQSAVDRDPFAIC